MSQAEHPSDDDGLRLLETELANLAHAMEGLNNALADLLGTLRQRNVQLQLALELRALQGNPADTGRWN